jgi:hypothetical protein
MPTVITCPGCNRQLRLPDNLVGKTVRCPTCQVEFTANEDTPAAAELPAHEEEYAPPVGEEHVAPRRSRRPIDDDEGDYDDNYEERPSRRRGVGRDAAKSAVAGPAIALMVAAGLGIAMSIASLGYAAITTKNQPPAFGNRNDPGYELGRMIGFCGCGGLMVGWSLFVLASGYQMLKLKYYGLSYAGAIIAMLPLNHCCLLGLPFGIWALVVLSRPEVKDAFR